MSFGYAWFVKKKIITRIIVLMDIIYIGGIALVHTVPDERMSNSNDLSV